MADTHDEKYTEPELRRKIKDEIQASEKGGKPGEWSARKSQLLVQEYERQGGGYKGPKDERQRSLETWGEEDWQTEDGDADARKEKTTERYLPKDVWDKLSQKERRKAMQTKEEGSKEGKQHVSWTPAVKQAMHDVQEEHGEPSKQKLYEQARELNIEGRSTMNKAELAKAIEKVKT